MGFTKTQHNFTLHSSIPDLSTVLSCLSMLLLTSGKNENLFHLQSLPQLRISHTVSAALCSWWLSSQIGKRTNQVFIGSFGIAMWSARVRKNGHEIGRHLTGAMTWPVLNYQWGCWSCDNRNRCHIFILYPYLWLIYLLFRWVVNIFWRGLSFLHMAPMQVGKQQGKESDQPRRNKDKTRRWGKE